MRRALTGCSCTPGCVTCGMADIAFTTASVGAAPFGFDFDRAGHLLVSDAALTTGRSGAWIGIIKQGRLVAEDTVRAAPVV